MAPKKVVTAPDHELAKWKLNSLVLCRYMNGEVYYEAKIINITRGGGNNDFIYRVHYQGWNARHDEDISEADANSRFKVHTQHDAVVAKEVIKNALQQSKKKSFRKSVDDSDRAVHTPSPSGDPYKKIYLTSGGSSQRQLTKRGGDPSIKQPPHKQRHVGKDGQIVSGPGLRFENVVLSEKLASILKLDHLLVREMFYLPILPAPCSVDEIVDQFELYLEEKKLNDKKGKGLEEFEATNMNANLEFAKGLRDYFNVFLKSRFLYAFERERHDKYMAQLAANGENQDVHVSAHYGLPHLLRLLVRLPETLESTKIRCTAMTVAMVKYRASVFVHYLHFHWTDFFHGQEDYAPASLNYMTNIPIQHQKFAAAMEVDASPKTKASVVISCENSNKENEFNSFISATPMEC